MSTFTDGGPKNLEIEVEQPVSRTSSIGLSGNHGKSFGIAEDEGGRILSHEQIVDHPVNINFDMPG